MRLACVSPPRRRTGSWLVVRASSRVSGAPEFVYRALTLPRKDSFRSSSFQRLSPTAANFVTRISGTSGFPRSALRIVSNVAHSDEGEELGALTLFECFTATVERRSVSGEAILWISIGFLGGSALSLVGGIREDSFVKGDACLRCLANHRFVRSHNICDAPGLVENRQTRLVQRRPPLLTAESLN